MIRSLLTLSPAQFKKLPSFLPSSYSEKVRLGEVVSSMILPVLKISNNLQSMKKRKCTNYFRPQVTDI